MQYQVNSTEKTPTHSWDSNPHPFKPDSYITSSQSTGPRNTNEFRVNSNRYTGAIIRDMIIRDVIKDVPRTLLFYTISPVRLSLEITLVFVSKMFTRTYN